MRWCSRPSSFSRRRNSRLYNGRGFCSNVTLSAHYGTTGIARVIREYAKWAVETGCGVPTIVSKSLDLAPAYPQQMPGRKLTIETGDILFLFDWMGNEPATFIRLMEAAVQKGAHVVLGLHDILPFMYPGLFSADTGPALRTLVDRGISLADGIVTVSRCAAEDIRAYIVESGLPYRPGLGIGWNHLGADFQSAEPAGEVDPKLAGVFKSTPVFLMVGTVEPRKGHRTALAAFDRLWRDGADVCCLIIGGMYWNARSIGEEIRAHPEFGRRLFWFDEASDADVAYAYRHATSLIFASLSEGFGLPLVEAAKFGLPIIASDITVFREIAGDAASYFEALDAESLAARLRESLAGKRIPPLFPVRTWHELALDLFTLLRSENYQLALPPHVSLPASVAS